MNSNINVLSWILVAVLFLMMLKTSYPLMILLDLLQFLHLHVYVIVTPLPYLYMESLSALKNVNFVFLPALWSNPNPNTNGTYYDFQEDTTFLGNLHPFIFFFLIFGGTYLLCWLLTFKCNKIKCLRKQAKQIFK